MMNAPPRTEAAATGHGACWISHTASGNTAAPTIDPIEMWRVDATTATNTTTIAATASGARHRNAPRKLATALPPRNFRNTGYACPAITANAAALIQRSEE